MLRWPALLLGVEKDHDRHRSHQHPPFSLWSTARPRCAIDDLLPRIAVAFHQFAVLRASGLYAAHDPTFMSCTLQHRLAASGRLTTPQITQGSKHWHVQWGCHIRKQRLGSVLHSMWWDVPLAMASSNSRSAVTQQCMAVIQQSESCVCLAGGPAMRMVMTRKSSVRGHGPVATLLMLLASFTLPGAASAPICWCSCVSNNAVAVNRHHCPSEQY